MNSNIFMNDSYTVKKPVYQGVERNRDFEKNPCCNKCAKKKRKRK
jgi:hypothetical protein